MFNEHKVNTNRVIPKAVNNAHLLDLDTNKLLKPLSPRESLMGNKIFNGLAGSDIESWFYEKRNKGIKIEVSAAGKQFTVIGIARDMKDAIIFVAKSGADIYVIKFNKYDEVRVIETESGKVYTDIAIELRSHEDVAGLKGHGAVLKIDYLHPLRTLNPNMDINLSEIQSHIGHISVDEATLPVTQVLGAGRMGLVLEVSVDDAHLESTDNEDDNKFVFKIGVTDALINDLDYELRAQPIIAGRIGDDYVPSFRAEKSIVALRQESDTEPFKYGQAIAMPKVKQSEALSSWDRSDNASSEDVLSSYLSSVIISNELHKRGGVQGDAHSRNMLRNKSGDLVMIDFDQFRYVDFDFTFAYQLLITEELLPTPAKLDLAITMLNRVIHNSMQLGLMKPDVDQLTEQIAVLMNLLAERNVPNANPDFAKIESEIINVVNFLSDNNIDQIAFSLRNPEVPEGQPAAKIMPFVINMNTEISEIFKNYNIDINWNQVVKQRPDLWISPNTPGDEYFGVVHPRSVNHAIYMGGLLDKDFNGLAAAENRTKVLEMMHALRLPFYTQLYDYDNGKWLPCISGKDWDMNNKDSAGYTDIPLHYGRTVIEKTEKFNSGKFDELFISRDFFVQDAQENSKLKNLSEQKLRAIYQLLKNYFVEYDLIYTWKLIEPHKSEHGDVIELISRIIQIVVMEAEGLSTDEVAAFSIPMPVNKMLADAPRDEDGVIAEDALSTELLEALGMSKDALFALVPKEA